MELDELKRAWAMFDRRLDQDRVSLRQLQAKDRVRSAWRGLQPLIGGQVLQIVAGVSLVVLFAPRWTHHAPSGRFLVPHLLVYAYGLCLILCAGRTLSLLHRIDYAAPVLQIQRRLLELHRWRARIAWPLLATAGCFVWIPMMLAVFGGWGLDVRSVRPGLVGWDVAAGVVCLILLCGWWLYARRLGHDFGGRSIRRAQEELREIERFVDE